MRMLSGLISRCATPCATKWATPPSRVTPAASTSRADNTGDNGRLTSAPMPAVAASPPVPVAPARGTGRGQLSGAVGDDILKRQRAVIHDDKQGARGQAVVI